MSENASKQVKIKFELRTRPCAGEGRRATFSDRT